jgi:hypothetical protein
MVGDGPRLFAGRSVAGSGCLWPRRCAAGVAGACLDAITLTAQFLETRVNDRKIIGRSRSSALTPQFFDASADHRKIISRTSHISSPPL